MKNVKDKNEKSVPQKEEAKEHVNQPDRKRFNLQQFTGKEVQRLYEWIQNKDQIRIKLTNGETVEGYLKWNDQFAVKLVGKIEEIILPKHSILYYIDLPKTKK